MDTHTEYGQAAYALTINSIIQAQSRRGYWVSGGAVGPGTSTTAITTSVDAGQVTIGNIDVDFAGGETEHPPADSNPRVDVVSVTVQGDLDVTPGTPADFAPTHDAEGNPIQNHTPFGHWEPAPDDGRNVQGVPLAVVLIRPNVTDSTDLTDAAVNDELLRMAGPEQSAYVLGNGADNGQTTITVNDADFTVQDQTDAEAKYLHRDHSAGTLKVGASNAAPKLGAPLDADNQTVDNVTELNLAPPSNIDFESSEAAFSVRDQSKGGEETISIDGDNIHHRRNTDYHRNYLTGVTSIQFHDKTKQTLLDIRGESNSVLWKQSYDGTDYTAALPLPNGNILTLRNQTDNLTLFEFQTDGAFYTNIGGIYEKGQRVLTRHGAARTYLPQSGGTLSGDVGFTNGDKTIWYGGFDGSLSITHRGNGNLDTMRFEKEQTAVPLPLNFPKTYSESAPEVAENVLFRRQSDGKLCYADASGNAHALY